MRRPGGDRHRDDDDSAARPAAVRARSTRCPAGAACRASPSSSTARSSWCRGPNPSRREGALKTTVPVVPDAPIGDFRLSLFGGKKGYIANTRSLCGKPPVTTVEYVAQNGKRLTQKVRMKVPCGGGSSSKKKRR